jgi:uncharacterized protein DUF6804
VLSQFYQWGTNVKLNVGVWLVPALLALIAIAPLPHGFYTLLRVVVCGASAFLAYRQYEQKKGVDGWALFLGLAAVLFNPLIPVYLTRGIWFFLDIAVAGLLVGHLLYWRKHAR